MNEKEIMLSAVNSVGYFILKSFELDTGEITEDSFVESIKEELGSFLELMEATLENYNVLPEVKEALKYELAEGSYDLGSFLLWLDKLFGNNPSLTCTFYCSLIEEIHGGKMVPKKVCKIIGTPFSYLLEIDGKCISFQGYSNAQYFETHYKSLGYEIQYFVEGDYKNNRSKVAYVPRL